MNIYVGGGSAYARNEGVYVPGRGISPETLGGVIALILRDAARGWSYDRGGNPVPFSWGNATNRLRYLTALYAKHESKEFSRFIREVAEAAIAWGRVPPSVRVVLAGPRAPSVAREIVDLGIADPDQVSVVGWAHAQGV